MLKLLLISLSVFIMPLADSPAFATDDDIGRDLSTVLEVDDDAEGVSAASKPSGLSAKTIVVAFLKSARYELALKALENAKKIGERDRLLLYIMCSAPLRNYDSAIKRCNSWLSKNPKATERSKAFVHALIGDLQRRHHNLDAAIDAYSTANKLSEDQEFSAMLRKTQLLRDFKRKQLSQEQFSKIITTEKLSMSDAWLSHLLLQAPSKTPIYEVELPKKSETSTSAKDWHQVKTLMSKAKSLEAQGDFDKATSQYATASKLCPTEVAVQSALANCTFTAALLTEKDLDNAKTLYKELSKRFPANWIVLNNSGSAMYIQGETNSAAALLKEALALKDIPKEKREAIDDTLRMCATIDMLQKHYEPLKKK